MTTELHSQLAAANARIAELQAEREDVANQLYVTTARAERAEAALASAIVAIEAHLPYVDFLLERWRLSSEAERAEALRLWGAVEQATDAIVLAGERGEAEA